MCHLKCIGTKKYYFLLTKVYSFSSSFDYLPMSIGVTPFSMNPLMDQPYRL